MSVHSGTEASIDSGEIDVERIAENAEFFTLVYEAGSGGRIDSDRLVAILGSSTRRR
jgi:hypothetical protein